MVEETVTITVSRYSNLIEIASKFNMLTDAIFDASYSFNFEQLYFSDDPIRMLMKLWFPNTCQKKLDELKKAKEEKEKGE